MGKFAFPGGANTAPAGLIGDDEDKWHYVKDVPVFDEHDGAEEELEIVFTPEVLQRIIQQNNQRIEESGDLVPVTSGHTGGTEAPEVLGWAFNFHLGKFGKDQRAAIFCDMKFTPDKFVKVQDLAAGQPFPRRSIELWDDYVIDPIALKDKPILDTVALLGSERPARNLGLGEKIASKKYRYQIIEEETLNPEDLKSIVEALTSLPEWQFLRQCMESKTALEEEEAPMGDAPAEMEDEPEEDKMEEEDKLDPAKLRLQRDQLKRKFAKAQSEWTEKLDTVQAENKTLFQKIEQLERKERVSHRTAILMQLEAEGYAFDMAEELELVADYEPARFEKHVNLIRKNYRKAPINLNVKVANIPEAGGSPVSNPQEVLKQATLRVAQKYKEAR